MFRYSLQVIVFLIGIVVMSVQLLTGRILAPLFGDTVLVWGSIIGVMILAMSMGYWFGGLLADKYDAKKLLFYSTLLLATSVIAMYLLKEIAYSHPLLAAIAITFLPGLFSGATMPFALKINTKQLSKIGHSYGSLSAASAIGSVIGVFATIFFLLPFFGVQKTLLTIIICSVLVIAFLNKWFFLVLLLTPLLFMQLTSNIVILEEENALFLNQTVDETFESPYGPVRVHDRQGLRYLVVNDGTMSVMNISNPLQEIKSWDYLTCMQELVEDDDRVYMIGLGAGTLPQRLVTQGVKVTAVEINPVVVEVAKNYFGLSKVEVRVADARYDLQQESMNYDVILMDVMHYDESFYRVPPHLLTKEFFELTKNRLTKEGTLVLHLPVSNVDRLLPQVENTLLEVFNGYVTKDCKGLQVISSSNEYERNDVHEGVEILTDDKMMNELK